MYGYEDIIINPKDDNVSELIGKPVYFGDSPSEALKMAMDGDSYGCLVNISEDGFIIVDTIYECIIPKKSPEYRPFNGMDRFLIEFEYKKNEFNDNFVMKKDGNTNLVLWNTGIHLLHEEEYCLVTEIDNSGLCINGFYYNWDELLDDYRFLDGSKCGICE